MEERVNIEHVDQILTSAKGKAEELSQSTHSLPPVNEDGSSDCEFAEEWYAKHEELRTDVQGLLAQVHEYLTAVEDEITKLSHDLAVISTHEDRLHRDAPRAHFSEAEAQVAALYNRYRQLRQQIIDTIVYIDQVLQDASTKRFPGGVPRKWPGLQARVPARTKAGEASTGSQTAQELDALFDADRRNGNRS